MEGRIRSTYGMTEPQVASSDATNMELQIDRDGDHYVLNGRKWWSSNIYHPLCEFVITMGVSNPDNPRHQRHSMVIVPKDTPGLEIVRPYRSSVTFTRLPVTENSHTTTFVPIDNIILGEGRGFEIAQGRLGPGRFQYAMTNVGMAQRMLDLMCTEPNNEKLSAASCEISPRYGKTLRGHVVRLNKHGCWF